MDPTLRALCLEVADGDVDSEHFAWLLIETGVSIDGPEWDLANRLLKRGETMSALARRIGETLH